MEYKGHDKKSFQGVITVEMSYLIPMILLIFLLVVYTVFYYHDKCILAGAASETAVAGAQMERRPDKDSQSELSEFYQERIGGKLIFFSGVQVSVDISRKWVEVNAYANRRKMQVHILQRAAITEPEKTIRRKQILENIAQTNGDDNDAGNNSADKNNAVIETDLN